MTDLVSTVLPADALASLKKELRGLVTKRASCKSKITKFSNKIRDLVHTEELTNKSFQVHKKCIEQALDEVREWDRKISDILSDNEHAILDPSILEGEIDKQTDYTFEVESFLSDKEPSEPSNDVSVRNDTPMPKLDAKAPGLECGHFSGEKDRFEFRTFLSQFKNASDNWKTKIKEYNLNIPLKYLFDRKK